MSENHGRRRLLRLAGAGAAVALAGCSELTGDDEGTETTPEAPPDIEGIDVSESAVTAFVEPDGEEIQALQADLQERIEDEKIDRMEAQGEFQERQLELVAEEVEAFEEYAADTDGITVEESIVQAGAILIDGDPEVIQEALNNGAMDGLLPGERFVEIARQAAGPEGPAANGSAEAGAGENVSSAGNGIDANGTAAGNESAGA